MAAVSLLGSVTFDTNSGTKTVTATPAVGDLIIIVTANSGSTGAYTPTDNNSSGTYTTINSALSATSADMIAIHIRTALIASASSTVFTSAPGATTGGGLAVIKVTGMQNVGAAAAVQSAVQNNGTAGTTPAPVLGATPLINNALIAAVLHSDVLLVTPRAGWTELYDNVYSTPSTGLEVMSINSGETSATITWGGTVSGIFGDVVIELNVPFAASLTEAGSAATTQSGIVSSSLTEAAAATDNPSVISIVSRTEAAAAADTPTGAMTASSSLTEAAAATDSVTGNVTYSNSLSEAASASNTQTATMSPAATLSEAASATDSPAATPTMNATLSEAGSAATTQSVVAVASLSEAAAASDALPQPTAIGVLTESLTATASESGAMTATASIVEAASAIDAETVVAAGALLETATAADAQSATMNPNASLTEAANATDIYGPFSTSEAITEDADAEAELEPILYARWDYLPTVISQYRNSPILLALIEYFSQWIDQDYNVNQFYLQMWNITTAEGYGLDVWGRIVGVDRVLEVQTGTFFEFEQQAQVSPLPFGGGPFFAGNPSTESYILTDTAFRQLILAKAMSNICSGAIPAINAILMFLFPDMGNCYVTDGEDMTMEFVFGAPLTPVQFAIISETGVLPRPVGVAASIVQP